MFITQPTRSAKDTARLGRARVEVHARGLKEKAERFVRMIMSDLPHSRNKPWKDYVILSASYSYERGCDCMLPHVDGMHLYLRERFAKQPENRKPPRCQGSSTTSNGQPQPLQPTDAIQLDPQDDTVALDPFDKNVSLDYDAIQLDPPEDTVALNPFDDNVSWLAYFVSVDE
jgi:hypothetical protein